MSGLSKSVIEAVAKDFIEDSVNLETARQDVGVTYQLDGYFTRYRTEYEDGTITLSKIPTSDFIGGALFTLGESNMIPAEYATPTNAARISYVLGYLAAGDGESNA